VAIVRGNLDCPDRSRAGRSEGNDPDDERRHIDASEFGDQMPELTAMKTVARDFRFIGRRV
jgi:hypothetical protein